MKQTKIEKISVLLVAAIILVGAIIGVGVSATTPSEITETENIHFNVEHKGAMHLACSVETTDVPEGAVVGIMVWAPDVENCTVANKLWESYDIKDDGAGRKYYASMPIAAKDIGTQYKYAVVAKTENSVIVVSVPKPYSVADWANDKLEHETDEARINLYKKVIAYGEAAAAVLK